MPLRSPKMYSFIFGFQRLVWCPKCTPASSRSVIAIAAKKCLLLSFTELEALPRSGHSVLLPLLGARVARQEAFGLERFAELGVVFDQRTCDAQPHGARLARHAAATNRGEDVELVRHLGQEQRLADLGA